MRLGLIVSLAVCVTLAATAAQADGLNGTVTLQIENDRIANTDRHYTHGTRLAWVSDKQNYGPAWVKDMMEVLYPLADLRAGRIGFSLGHSIFSPEDTSATELVRNDRPYAGWLYVGASVGAETKNRYFGIDTDVLDTVELGLGIVGPYAFGEEIQNTVHDLIGVSRSNGWGNQLRNEPGAMLVFERNWRPASWRPDFLAPSGIEFDVVPHVGGALGNVMTFFHGGGTLRLGHGLSADYGPPLIRPALSGLAALDDVPDFGWYLFAGADLRVVAHNIFLDGNTIADSHSVDKRILVGDFQLGIAAFYHNWRISFTNVLRTREFEGQRQADRYGALALSARF